MAKAEKLHVKQREWLKSSYQAADFAATLECMEMC